MSEQEETPTSTLSQHLPALRAQWESQFAPISFSDELLTEEFDTDMTYEMLQALKDTVRVVVRTMLEGHDGTASWGTAESVVKETRYNFAW